MAIVLAKYFIEDQEKRKAQRPRAVDQELMPTLNVFDMRKELTFEADDVLRVARIADRSGYRVKEIFAGLEYYRRKNREVYVPGEFDKDGRFHSSEDTQYMRETAGPTRNWPYSEMNAARSVGHCAQLFGVEELHIKRLCRAFEALYKERTDDADLKNILKRPVRPKKPKLAPKAKMQAQQVPEVPYGFF